MATFDPEIWRLRACKRFAKASEGGKSSSGALLLRDMQAIEGLDTVVNWCYDKGLIVVFSKEPNGVYYDNCITLCGRLAPELQLHLLLHECGHYIVSTRDKGNRFEECDSTDTQSTRHRIDFVDEEYEAWYQGRCLSEKLGVVIDIVSWHAHKDSFLKTYMRWVLKLGEFKKNGRRKKTKKASKSAEGRRTSPDNIGNVSTGDNPNGKDNA